MKQPIEWLGKETSSETDKVQKTFAKSMGAVPLPLRQLEMSLIYNKSGNGSLSYNTSFSVTPSTGVSMELVLKYTSGGLNLRLELQSYITLYY